MRDSAGSVPLPQPEQRSAVRGVPKVRQGSWRQISERAKGWTATVSDDLYECEFCSSQPGSPSLCAQCLENRTIAVAAWKGPRRNKPATAYERDQQVCSDCKCYGGSHFTHCVKVASAVAESAKLLPRLPSTEYEREREALYARIAKLEQEVARLKAWTRPPGEMCLKCGAGFVTAGHASAHSCGTEDT